METLNWKLRRQASLFRCRNQNLGRRLQFTAENRGSPASQEGQSRAAKCQRLLCGDFSLPEYEVFDSASLQNCSTLLPNTSNILGSLSLRVSQRKEAAAVSSVCPGPPSR